MASENFTQYGPSFQSKIMKKGTDEAYASNQMTMLFPEVRAGLGVGSGSSPRSGLGLG